MFYVMRPSGTKFEKLEGKFETIWDLIDEVRADGTFHTYFTGFDELKKNDVYVRFSIPHLKSSEKSKMIVLSNSPDAPVLIDDEQATVDPLFYHWMTVDGDVPLVEKDFIEDGKEEKRLETQLF